MDLQYICRKFLPSHIPNVYLWVLVLWILTYWGYYIYQRENIHVVHAFILSIYPAALLLKGVLPLEAAAMVIAVCGLAFFVFMLTKPYLEKMDLFVSRIERRLGLLGLFIYMLEVAFTIREVIEWFSHHLSVGF